MKKTPCLCVSVIKLTQRQRGTESLTFLTGLTGLTRLENESLLRDKIILTQRGKGAEGQRPHLYNSPSSLLLKGNNFLETTSTMAHGRTRPCPPSNYNNIEKTRVS